MKVIHSIAALTLIAALCKQVDLAADGVDAGVYTVTYGWNGKEWLITSHHSSVMPEPVKQ